MRNNMTDKASNITEDQILQAISKRLASGGVQSISVDGMSASYSSLKDQLEALSALKKMEASKNPLGCLKIFKVKNQDN